MTPAYRQPPNPKEFDAAVWEIVRQVPPGKVTTYGQVAAMIPTPESMNLRDYGAFSPRWVGGSMRRCPDDVPWQRVINSQGKISIRPGEGQNIQRELLEEEGVLFDERERVDLSRYGWNGPPPEWLKAHGFLQPPALGKPRQTELGI